ncbi:MAG: hypothetical protein N3A38_02915 [Planctomycetota bacterium]|nr:hypothetical protein [Planctomycetota bacterium]
MKRGSVMTGSERVSGRGRPSSRQTSRGAQPVPAQGISSRETRASRRSTRTGSGGKELVICVAIIAVLVVICAVVYVVQSGARDKQERYQRAETKYYEEGFDRVAARFAAAEEAGRKFCMGEEPNADPSNPEMRKVLEEKLFGPFRGDADVYNVLYDRMYKRGTRSYPDQRWMHEGLTKYDAIKTQIRNGVQLQFGYVDSKSKTQPVFAARKSYSPANKDDKVNLGGQIVLVMKAPPPPRKD